MSTSQPALDQRFPADLSALFRRVATLEQQIVQAVGAYGAYPCTSATRPASPRLGQEIYETDTTRFLIWSGSAWEQKAFAAYVCTSSTRPASPFQGMKIYETDTGNTVVWSGTAWETMVHEGAWTSYTPTWTAAGTAPAVGNGTLTGAWSKVGRTLLCRGVLTIGSTTTFGTGSWFFALPPFTAVIASGADGSVGSVWANSTGASNRAGVAVVGLLDGAQHLYLGSDGTGAPWNSTIPFTWTGAGVGTVVGWSIAMEVTA